MLFTIPTEKYLRIVNTYLYIFEHKLLNTYTDRGKTYSIMKKKQ